MLSFGRTADQTLWAGQRIKRSGLSADGRLDVIVLDATDGSVRALLGSEDGTFAASQSIDWMVRDEARIGRFTLGDFNGDGRIDVAATTVGADEVLIATNEAAPTPTPRLAPNITPGSCSGDCDDNQEVTVNELVRAVDIVLDHREATDCPQLDADHNDEVSIAELIRAVENALSGCR